MSTIDQTGVPADVLADMQAVAEHVATGKPLDPAVSARVAHRSRLAQEELRRKYGVREIAVDLIREVREEG